MKRRVLDKLIEVKEAALKIEKHEMLILSALVFLAFINLAFSISSGMPNYPMVDEIIFNIEPGYKLFLSNSYEVANFKYPSLSLYLSKFILDTVSFIGVNVEKKDVAFLLRAGFTILNSISVVFLYCGTKKLFTKRTAIVTSLLFAFSLYYNSIYYVGPDALLIFFSNLTFFLFTFIYKSHNRNTSVYVLFPVTFVVIGFSISAKYSATVYLVVMAYLFVVNGYYKNLNHSLLIGYSAFLVIITFFLLNPYAMIDTKSLIADFIWNINHYKSGHAGLEANNSLIFYLKTFFYSSFGKIGGGLMVLGLLLLTKDKRYKELALLTLVPFFLILQLSTYKVVIARNLVMAMPYFFIVVAYALVGFNSSNYFHKAAKVFMLFWLIYISQSNFLVKYDIFTAIDSRSAAEKWIEKNLPPKAMIYLSKNFSRTGYLPKIDPEKYHIIKNNKFNPLNENEYYVATYGDYGRYLKKKNGSEYFYPEKAKEVLSYLKTLEIIKEFPQKYSGFKITVFKKKAKQVAREP